MPVLKEVNLPFARSGSRFFSLCVLVFGFHSSSVLAASVVLQNGDRMTGEVIRLSDDILTFKSPVFGKIELPWEDVLELTSDDGVTVQLKDGTQIKGAVAFGPLGEVTVDEGGEDGPMAINKAEVSLLNPPVFDPSIKYSGHANLGGIFNRGNSDDDSLSFDAEFIARTPGERYTLATELNEARSSGESTTSNRYLSTQYDAFLSEKDYLFVNAKAEQDTLSDLNFRGSLGAGYGHQFYETDRAKMSTEYGVAYVKENYILAPDESFPSLSFGLNYERKFWDKRLVFFNNHHLSVSMENASDSLYKTKLGLRVPIIENVNVSTQINLDYDNMPPPDVKKADTSLIFSVGYGF